MYHWSLNLKPQLFVKYFIQKPTQSYVTDHTNLSRKDKIISKISERKPRRTITYFGAYIYFHFHWHSTREPTTTVCIDEHGWPILFSRPTQEPVLATASTGKTLERFWETKQVHGSWTRRDEITKKETPGSRRSMLGYIQICTRLKRENI